ncbi:protein MKS1-like [Phragmites australis]|uniref:protein MKS1-like n=1 Tax=Phragmites australis TaxID=29695 RepID=UPI002D76C1EB|nr:protein MKS1-like [Phragmites australis]
MHRWHSPVHRRLSLFLSVSLSPSNLSCPLPLASFLQSIGRSSYPSSPPLVMASTSFGSEVPRSGGAGSGPLGVRGASRKIGKTGTGGQQDRKPVIIYMVSPKVIHVEAHEFMPLVQRLTGPDAGRGDNKSRPSTSSSSPTQEPEGARNKGAGVRTAPPVRVKARALNRPSGGPAVSVSVTATRHQAAAPSGAATAASPSGFMFHDLSPLRGAALKSEHPLVSPGWLHHVGDHFLSPGAAAVLGSPSAGFLDIFGPLSSQQQ